MAYLGVPGHHKWVPLGRKKNYMERIVRCDVNMEDICTRTAEMLGLHSKCKGHKLVNATSDALSLCYGHECIQPKCREKWPRRLRLAVFFCLPSKFNSSITAPALYFFPPCLLVEPCAVAVAAGTSAASARSQVLQGTRRRVLIGLHPHYSITQTQTS